MKIKSIDFVAKGKAEFREVEADINALAPNPDLLGVVYNWKNY